jgi:hypothetical protein
MALNMMKHLYGIELLLLRDFFVFSLFRRVLPYANANCPVGAALRNIYLKIKPKSPNMTKQND